MLKRNSKSFFGLILVIALVFSMFPTMPSSVAYAAATNLLPSTLTLNGNIKASSQQSTRTAVNIGNSVTWTLGANTVYSASGSNLWVAIDLGSPSNIEGFNFHTTATDVNTINRSSQYELSYSNDSSLWNKLSTTPNNNAINFSPTANGWSSAAIVPTNIATGTVANGTYSWSLDPNTGYYTSDLTFTAPITARYILINYTLKPSATGQLGIGLLKIAPPVTLSSSSGSFYKTLQNTISTQVNLDAATSFTGIANGSYTLVEGTDYTVDADNVVTFSNTYLSSLNGSYNLRFNFSSSQGSSFLPYVLTVAAAADSSLLPQGTAYIPMLPSTISTTMNLNGNHFTSISEGTTILPSSAYAVSGNTVTFNQSFLDTLSMGTHSFIFNFDQGNPQTFMLTISGKPPVAGIDYRYWTLQEPLPGGAGQTSQTLQAGYADPYFYVGADGSQVFMDTAVGGTTSGSAHPRSELREYDPIAGTDAAWLPVGANAMTGTVAVTKLGTLNGVGWTTIGQVFDQNVTTLCEFEYGYDPAYPNSNIRILYEPSGINSLGYQYLPIKIPLNQYFTYRMTLNDGVLSIYLNGNLIFNGQTASPSQVIPPNHLYYFKAGNYDQTAMNGNVNYIPYTVVQFNSLNVYHAPTVDNTPPVTTDNAPANWVNNDVTVTLTASDSGSGVHATYYTVDGGAQQTGTTVTISAEGTHTLTYWSVDKAGNIEVAHTATVQINKTVPAVTVTVHFDCSDTGSGVASCIQDTKLSTEGAGEYNFNVANSVSNISITPTAADAGVVIRVNGTLSVSGATCGPVNLTVGANRIEIEVTPQGGAAKTYTITVNRENVVLPTSADLSNLAVSAGSLAPVFKADTTGYTVNVANNVSSISVTPSASDAVAVIRVNGTTSVSGATYGPLNLAVGANKIEIEVTPQSGAAKTYTITVNRENVVLPTSTDLSNLAVSAGSLAPVFTADTTGYTVNVANNVSSISVTPSAADAGAVIRVNGTTSVSGATYGPLNLAVGANKIKIEVTPQSGASKTYTITVNREKAPDTSGPSDSADPSDSSTTVNHIDEKQTAETYIDDKTIDNILKSSTNDKIKLSVDSSVNADQIMIIFTNSAMQKLITQKSAVSLNLGTQLGSYELPLKEINLQDLAAKLGVAKEKVNVEVIVSKDNAAVEKAKSSGKTVLGAVEFTLRAASSEGKSIEISNFTTYVARTIKAESPLNARNLAAVRVETDKQGNTVYQPVPFTVSGTEATIYSRTNSTYMLMENKVTFADLNNHWAKNDIERMANKMIVQGVSQNQFLPEQAITRAEFAALIARTLGLKPGGTSKNLFIDVHQGDWFEDQVYAVAGAGIVAGYEDHSFHPNALITRQEMAVMIQRAMNFAGYDHSSAAGNKVKFTDEHLFDQWAQAPIAEIAGMKIIEGADSGKFDPAAAATRAQSTVILSRMLAVLQFTK
ncbi:cadherin-like beta sandwich domain-containing protein [Paenibacillus planticolens]|uniref:S-layer family protein n=1 Tax=Paenibacillus planticolens TaxID=2654976 RepID=A0ABX1ZXW9_9BACL|nr:cadherin-like beta sandwich domain-containing protein [Paenibacillus planticolens]NOV04746.1 hypothetical protein [Paenibacillus planticolens]